jgi:hypothetical protein
MIRTPTALGAGLLAAVVLAACGGDGEQSGDTATSGGANAARYKEAPEHDIAQVADDLQAAARGEDADAICSEIFTERFSGLVAERSGSPCEDTVGRRFATKNAEFVVRAIKVRGDKAVATVVDRAGTDNEFVLLEQDGDWRIDGISNAAG